MRALDKFTKIMKELERYLGTTYRNICQLDITTNTPANFPNPEMPTIITDTGVERPKTDVDMTHLENRSIEKDIRQKPRKKDF